LNSPELAKRRTEWVTNIVRNAQERNRAGGQIARNAQPVSQAFVSQPFSIQAKVGDI
jgi:hypothetical protein